MLSIPDLGKRVFYTTYLYGIAARDRAQDLCFCSKGLAVDRIGLLWMLLRVPDGRIEIVKGEEDR